MGAKRFIRVHKTCPYYDEKEHACSREGCHLLTPCILHREQHHRVFVRNLAKNYK